jgi:proline racemase
MIPIKRIGPEMQAKRILSVVDSHTEGEPARVVVGGAPPIPGSTFLEKWQWAKKNLEDLRRLLMFEPRGGSHYSGSILTAPSTPGADFGVIFIEVSGFLPMCGHGTIATATVLVETGMVAARAPYTDLVLDTPAGLVKTRVHVENGRVIDVTIQNVPAFVIVQDLIVHVADMGAVPVDIAYGGNFYAMVQAEPLGLDLAPSCYRQIIDAGTRIRDAINDQVEVVHPENDAIRGCSHVRFLARPRHPAAHGRNTVLYSSEGIDRSPCGTGTSAEMAVRYARGMQRLGEEFVSESIIGSIFYGTLIEETRVGPYPAVTPTIRGSAYLTGFNQILLDPRDPWPEGFLLGAHSRWGVEF